MTAPTSRAGVSRFLADYQSNTWYRVMVEVRRGVSEPHPTLPLFEFKAIAEAEASKIAGPTEVRAERSGDGAGASYGNSEGTHTSPAFSKDADASVSGVATPSPQPATFCQCGHPEDEHYLGSVCQKIEGMYVCGCGKFIGEAA